MWELGLLRAMGMNKGQILRITMYESFVNNMSSIILGFLIGLVISASLMAQFMLLLELPFELVVSIFMFVIAFLATFWNIRYTGSFIDRHHDLRIDDWLIKSK